MFRVFIIPILIAFVLFFIVNSIVSKAIILSCFLIIVFIVYLGYLGICSQTSNYINNIKTYYGTSARYEFDDYGITHTYNDNICWYNYSEIDTIYMTESYSVMKTGLGYEYIDFSQLDTEKSAIFKIIESKNIKSRR